MAIRHLTVRSASLAVVACSLLIVLMCVCSSTTKVTIVAIDEGYDIHIRTFGRSPLPLTAEGPFPKWCELSRFTVVGPGTNSERDGVKYKKYSIRKGVYSHYSGGSLWISEANQTLIVDAELSKKSNGLMNHSGRYGHVTVEHPSIVSLTIDTPTESVDGRYVRARGHFDEEKFRFEAAGRSFPSYSAPYGCKQTDSYEVVGLFHARDACHREEPQLDIITIKKINER
jgi:hypothetical protein